MNQDGNARLKMRRQPTPLTLTSRKLFAFAHIAVLASRLAHALGAVKQRMANP